MLGGQSEDEDNVPPKIYEQPELKQPDPSILVRITRSVWNHVGDGQPKDLKKWNEKNIFVY